MINIKRLFVLVVLLLGFYQAEVLAQKINQLDANGKRTGIWKKNYENGRIRYTGSFVAGKEVGTFKFYRNEAGSVPHIVKEYSVKSDSAFVQFFNPLGKLKAEGNMIGKNRVGVWKYYFTNGKIFSEENYSNGKLEGTLKNYYSNGKLTEESQYKDGLKNGVSKIYTEKGILIEEVIYIAGKLNGEAKYYDLNGKIKQKGLYKNGAKEGKWEFYIDGEITTEKPKRVTHRVPKSN